MQICVRAHDLGVKGIYPIIHGLKEAGADGAQLVCYKSSLDIEKVPAGITEKQVEQIGGAFKAAGLSIALIGAYFNPVHSDEVVMESGISERNRIPLFMEGQRIESGIQAGVSGA